MRIFSFFLLLFITVTAGKAQTVVTNIAELTDSQRREVTHLVVRGRQLSHEGNSDYRQMRDCLPQLVDLDLSGVRDTLLPRHALFANHRLRRIVLPDSLRIVDEGALYACSRLTELAIPASVREIRHDALAGCSSLRSLTLNGCPEIGDMAFSGLSGLQRIRVNSSVPPKATDGSFAGLRGHGVKLQIPKGALRSYRKAEGWRVLFERDKPAMSAPQQVCIIPRPDSIIYSNSTLRLDKIGRIIAPPELRNEVDYAIGLMNERTTWRSGNASGQMTLTIDTTISSNPEAYTLEITRQGIHITGHSPQAVFWGLMTLRQLLVTEDPEALCSDLPTLMITDQPRTRMRELMVDPARIFIPLEALREYVVEMAHYKMNALHLHLVDDQAWRIEIKAYPRLMQYATDRIGMDDMPIHIKGYYTQEEMREFVAFAARHHVEIIPEIEMPGHEVAAIHCYPELTCNGQQVNIRTTSGVSNELLCPGEEFVYIFLGNVMRELSDVFPSRYIHLGGDEAGNPALDCWTHCAKCRQLKERLGIMTTDRSENWRLQEYMFGRIIDTLQTKYDKTPMFWYETDFRKIPKGCITFAWRHGLTATAIQAARDNNTRIMMCPGEHCYLDYPAASGDMPEVNWGMPVTSLEQTYKLDPAWGCDEAFEHDNLWGVAGTLWSECITSPERLMYMTYPRAMAIAEAGWTQAQHRAWPDFRQRMERILRDAKIRWSIKSHIRRE